MKGERWDNVSDEGKSFIRRLLDVRPATRLSAPDMLRHPWLKQEDSVASNRELTGTVDEIRRFNTRRKLRAGFLQVRPMPMPACLCLPFHVVRVSSCGHEWCATSGMWVGGRLFRPLLSSLCPSPGHLFIRTFNLGLFSSIIADFCPPSFPTQVVFLNRLTKGVERRATVSTQRPSGERGEDPSVDKASIEEDAAAAEAAADRRQKSRSMGPGEVRRLMEENSLGGGGAGGAGGGAGGTGGGSGGSGGGGGGGAVAMRPQAGSEDVDLMGGIGTPKSS